MRRQQFRLAQKKRRTPRRIRTMKQLQGKSSRVRMYQLCMRVARVLQSGHSLLGATAFKLKQMRFRRLSIEICSSLRPSSFGTNAIAKRCAEHRGRMGEVGFCMSMLHFVPNRPLAIKSHHQKVHRTDLVDKGFDSKYLCSNVSGVA